MGGYHLNLFVKTDSFPLRTVHCRYSWTRIDVDFDYESNNFLEVYYNIDDDSDSNSDGNEQTNCFTPSLCYIKIRANFMFERSESYQNAFLMHFTRKLHVISNSIS